MPFLVLAFKNLLRHRIRSLLTLIGIAASIAVLFSIISFNRGFERGLARELERTGIHFMVVPSGCPHEVASLVLHGAVIPKFLDAEIASKIREVEGIALISPILVSQLPNPVKNRLDIAYGMEMSHISMLKPSWKIEGDIPESDYEIIAGSEVAGHDNIRIGDSVEYTGEKTFRVSGILERTGSHDDAFIYMPIKALQELLGKHERVTALGVRVSEPGRLSVVTEKLAGEVPGIQIVTIGQVMTSISNLASSAKILSLSIALIAVLISTVGVMNSILMAIFERTQEIGMMRAIGASRFDIFRITIKETVLLTTLGGFAGIIASVIGSGMIEGLVRKFMPYVPSGKMIAVEPWLAGLCIAFSIIVGILSGIYPAWKASKVNPIEAIRG
jgi:putative ABC transport system permease protein